MYFNPAYDENLFSDMNHLKSLPFAMCFLLMLFVSQSIKTQENTDFKTNSKVLYKLTQHPLQEKLFREEQHLDQADNLRMRRGLVQINVAAIN